MELIFQILVGLVTLVLLGLGAMSMFAPKKMVKIFHIEPIGNVGLSTVRSNIGGLFLGSVALIAWGYLNGQTLAFVAVAVLVGAVAVGRIVGLLADGFDKEVVPPLVIELVMAAILVMAHTQLGVG